MKAKSAVLVLLLAISCSGTVRHYLPAEDPERVIISESISNQKVNAFAEDSDGHIWIATFRGLNKYNVHEYHQFFCADDTTGLPDNQVNDLLRSSDGKLWVATVNGLALHTDKGCFRRFEVPSDNHNIIRIIESERAGLLFSNGSSLFRFDPEAGKLHPVIREMNSFISDIVADREGRMWVPTMQGLDCYETPGFTKSASIPSAHLIYHLSDAGNGELWMSGMGRMSIYDTRALEWKELPEVIRREPRIMHGDVDIIYPVDDRSILLHVIGQGMFLYQRSAQRLLFQDEAGFPYDLPEAEIRTIFKDSRQNLWFGTTDQGYSVSYYYKGLFNSNKYLTSFFTDKSVTSLCLDGSRLWICTLRDGLFVYDMQKQEISSVRVSHLVSDSNVGYIRASKVFRSSGGDIWILFSEKFQAVRCRFENGSLRKTDTIDAASPLSIAEDDRGIIWIGDSSGMLTRYDPGDKSFTTFPLREGEGWTFVTDLMIPEPGKMYAAAFNMPLFEINTYTGEIKELSMTEEDAAACIRRSVIVPNKLFMDSMGSLWTGTIANGLLRTEKGGHTVPMNGTPCLDITSIEQDRQGNIWVSTMNGLGKYDRTTGSFVSYFKEDGIGGNQFSDRASCLLPDGTLVFGGTHGLTWFNPLDVPQKRTVPLVFENLKIHNHLIRPTAGGPVEKDLARDPDITIQDWQNGFSISFAALDYSEHERTVYSYMMDGFDRYWVDAGNGHEAYYANLPPGKYQFRVRITNNNQSIVETEKSLNIRIMPPWYKSWWGRLALALVGLVLLSLIYILYRRIQKVRAENEKKVREERIEREKAEAARLQEKELNRIQMNYFSNVAHEFRTPLTMIAGPAAQLSESEGIKGQDRQLVRIIRSNTDWMLSLVNQLLDFNRIGNSKLQLKVAKTDITAPLRSVLDMFRYKAESKKIRLGSSGLEDSFVMWTDVDKVSKVVMNLLANALKFTPSGGKVSLGFDVLPREEAGRTFPLSEKDTEMQYACISVTDSGVGIPEGQEEKIFERFYQADNQGDTQGSGIGLFYARVLTGLHHGYIKGSNLPEGGARFTFILPTGAASYSEDERAEPGNGFVMPAPVPKTAGEDEGGDDNDSTRKRVAVIDDDIDVANYVKMLLSPYYNVSVYFDASSALKGMMETTPNLIISDVVMPGMSGYQLCETVKGELQLSHIPVILVTAKVAVESQVQGLGKGADAYVTKPFQPAYLLALVKSLLENREKLHRQLGSVTTTEEIEPEALSPRDSAFMKELYKLMEKEISDTELDITRISEKMKISRTKFYYKVKGLTGENPSTFFKRFKLNYAANLLKEGKHNMSEIAYMTGFNTLSHFSTSFKKQFGVPPSDYTG